MQLSIAEIKRRLPVGAKYTGEFVGKNAKNCRAGMEITCRIVRKQTATEMLSEFFGGPRDGESIFLNWKYTKADERDGAIYIIMTEANPPEEFLKITDISYP